MKKLSLSMRRANFSLSSDKKFYGETTHNSYMSKPNAISLQKAKNPALQKCHFSLGNAQHDFTTTSNNNQIDEKPAPSSPKNR